ncbi:MAG: hypothetical protein MJZ77_03845 [Bacteroidales bacterium]|nr:hypothetical protein [Bacteroidales bacterium]
MSDISGLNEARLYDGDTYVADYTEAWQQAHKAGLPEPENSGVVISGQSFADIKSFHLKNDNQVKYWGVNLEKNKSLFASGEKDCECVFQSAKFKKKGWLLLLELKYCKDEERNLTDNLDKAVKQVTQTYQTLVSSKIVDSEQLRVYCNIAAPPSSREPFTSFLTTQDAAKKLLDESKIHLLGFNEVLIMNEGYIKPPKIAI